jgi:hypothetical protein
MATIRWDENQPSNDSKAGYGAQEVRSIKTSLAHGLAVGMEFPGSGGGDAAIAGQLKAGSSRFSVGLDAAEQIVERNMGVLASDTSRLYIKDSTTTKLCGSPRMVENSQVSNRRKWIVASHTTTPGSSYTKQRVIPFNSIEQLGPAEQVEFIRFGDIPFVHLTSSDTRVSLGVSTITQGGFISELSYSGTTADFTLTWVASGWTDDALI